MCDCMDETNFVNIDNLLRNSNRLFLVWQVYSLKYISHCANAKSKAQLGNGQCDLTPLKNDCSKCTPSRLSGLPGIFS